MCGNTGPFLLRRSHITLSLSQIPACVWPFPFMVPQSPSVCLCSFYPEHAQPQGLPMRVMTSEPFACDLILWHLGAVSDMQCTCHPLSCSEEGKLSTSQDAACKEADSPEPVEVKCAVPRLPSSSPEQR